MLTFDKLKAMYDNSPAGDPPYIFPNVYVLRDADGNFSSLNYKFHGPVGSLWISLGTISRDKTHLRALDRTFMCNQEIRHFLWKYFNASYEEIIDPSKRGYIWSLGKTKILSFSGIYITSDGEAYPESPARRIIVNEKKDKRLHDQIAEVKSELISRLKLGVFKDFEFNWRRYKASELLELLFAASPDDWRTYIPLFEVMDFIASEDPNDTFDRYIGGKLEILRSEYGATHCEYEPAPRVKVEI